MGACCTCQISRGSQRFDGYQVGDEEEEREIESEGVVGYGDCGALVRLHGFSKSVSMHSQQGRKGINQDAMTVWENFTGDKDAIFCGVFDGHGPSGHKVAQHVRDILPSKLSATLKPPPVSTSNISNNADDSNSENNDDPSSKGNFSSIYSVVKASLLESFKTMDQALESETTIESYCSGATAVTVLKKGKHLMIANLGDSRATLCTRGNRDQLVPVQLTIDLKPHLQSERERIMKCKGRVMALEEEPNIYRIWMPDQDCPGLAMARAFGDFCLKDYGLISVPDVFYRKLSDKDEFVVLATDGIWDVLSNEEVIRIVASTRKRSVAAKQLVHQAVRAWKYKYPNAKIDDCAAVCLFFNSQRPLLTKSMSEQAHLSLNYSELGTNSQTVNIATEDGLETVLNCDVSNEQTAHRTGLMVNRRRPSREMVPVEN